MMNEEKIALNFKVQVYGELEKFSETISRSRCRIFYKGLNRNGTYITEEFAEKLISTIAYAPIKGIYEDDDDDADFEDHGEKRSDGKAYGVVPADYNFKWEEHLDDDGIKRTYACVDVLLWTAIYEEAREIPGKSQSMELYEPSIKGKWVLIEGKRVYQYEDGCFLGLQALGDKIEPCFEGAAFYTLKDMINELYTLYSNFLNDENNRKGGKKMVNFKLSDKRKHCMLFDILNKEYYTEENDWAIRYVICEVYDDYALCYDYQEETYLRAYYTKNDSDDTVTIDNTVKAFIIDVTEGEYNALNALRSQVNTFEQIDEKFAAGVEAQNNLEQKDEEIATYTTQIQEKDTQINDLNEKVDQLTNENATLSAYKLDIEKKEKQSIIDKYSNVIDDEIIATYTAKIDELSSEELDKNLSYELVKATPSIFSKSGAGVIPKDEPVTGVEAILNKYRNKNQED